MSVYSGILRSNENTGSNDEIIAPFSTPLVVEDNSPEFVNTTLSLRTVGARLSYQRWEVTAGIAEISDGVEFFINSVVKAHTKVMYVRMPRLLRSEVPDYPKFTLKDVYTRGITELEYNKSMVYRDNILKGEFIQFLSHNKVYLVTESTPGRITIYPSLRQPVDMGTQIKVGDIVTLYCKVSTDNIVGITYEDGILVRPGSYKFVENL